MFMVCLLCFNPTQDACFPTTYRSVFSRSAALLFQSYSGCLLPHDVVNYDPQRVVDRFNPTQDACFPTTTGPQCLSLLRAVSILLRMLASPRRGSTATIRN